MSKWCISRRVEIGDRMIAQIFDDDDRPIVSVLAEPDAMPGDVEIVAQAIATVRGSEVRRSQFISDWSRKNAERYTATPELLETILRRFDADVDAELEARRAEGSAPPPAPTLGVDDHAPALAEALKRALHSVSKNLFIAGHNSAADYVLDGFVGREHDQAFNSAYRSGEGVEIKVAPPSRVVSPESGEEVDEAEASAIHAAMQETVAAPSHAPALAEALQFYANEWDQDVDAERVGPGSNDWEGSLGDVEPSDALRADRGDKARAALAAWWESNKELRREPGRSRGRKNLQ